jgi:hypothetical protein
MGSLTPGLLRILSSKSLKYSGLSRSSIEPAYKAVAANSDLCLSFLQHCVGYGEKVIAWCLPSVASPTSSRVMAQHDLQKRTKMLLSEITRISADNAGSVQGLSPYYLTRFDGFHRRMCSLGSRKFKDAYNKALCLEQKTTSGLNTLLKKLSSWTDKCVPGLPDDTLPDVVILERLCELWEKERYSVRTALAILKNEPAPRLASARPRSLIMRWLMNLVHFS